MVAAREPLIWSSVVRSLTPVLLEYDLNPEVLWQEAALPLDEINKASGRVPLKKWLNFLDIAAERAGDPVFGIVLGRSCGPETLGAIGFLLLSSKTVLGALENLCRYLNVLQDATYSQVVTDEYETAFIYQIVKVDDEDCRQDVEFSLALTKRLVRIFSEGEAKALAVNFRHSPRVDRRIYEKHFKVPVYFDQNENSIVYPATVNLTKGKVLDTSLSYILQDYLERELEVVSGQNSFADQILNLLRGNSIPPPVTAKKVAYHLGLSEPTLFRKLRADGVRFGELLGQHNYSVAKEYLETTTMRLTQIAQIVGYSESASFSRAFSKWTGGMTPSTYRKKFSRL